MSEFSQVLFKSVGVADSFSKFPTDLKYEPSPLPQLPAYTYATSASSVKTKKARVKPI